MPSEVFNKTVLQAIAAHGQSKEACAVAVEAILCVNQKRQAHDAGCM